MMSAKKYPTGLNQPACIINIPGTDVHWILQQRWPLYSIDHGTSPDSFAWPGFPIRRRMQVIPFFGALPTVKNWCFTKCRWIMPETWDLLITSCFYIRGTKNLNRQPFMWQMHWLHTHARVLPDNLSGLTGW